MNLDALPEEFYDLTLVQLMAHHTNMDGDPSGPFESLPHGAYRGHSRPYHAPRMRHSGCPSLSRPSGGQATRRAHSQPYGATHSFTPYHTEEFYHAVDQDFDSGEVMRIDVDDDYHHYDTNMEPSTTFYDKMLKMMQQFAMDEKKVREDFDAKFSKMKTEFDSKLDTIACAIKRVEDQVDDINKELENHKEDIHHYNSKIFNMGYTIDTIEDRLEFKVEALQHGFDDPSDYSKWKDDQAYLACEEEEKKAYYEEEAIEMKPQGDENQLEEEGDKENVFSLEENMELNEAFCDMISHEDKPLGQPLHLVVSHEQGTHCPLAHSSPTLGDALDWKPAPISLRRPSLSSEDNATSLLNSQPLSLEDYQESQPYCDHGDDHEEEEKNSKEKFPIQQRKGKLEEMENFKKNENFLEGFEEKGNLYPIRTCTTLENHQESKTLEEKEEKLVGEEEDIQGKFKEEDFKRDKFQNSMNSETFEAMKYQGSKDEEQDPNGEICSAITPFDDRKFEEEVKLQGKLNGEELGRNKVQTLIEPDDSGNFRPCYSSSEEEEDLGLEEVPCCVTTRIPYEEVPGGDNLHLPRAYGDTGHTTGHDQGNTRPNPYLPPYHAYEDWSIAPRPQQGRTHIPYPRRADGIANRLPRHPYPVRLPHQIFRDNASVNPPPRTEIERLEGLIKQCFDQQERSTRTIHERIDMIERSVWGLGSRTTDLEWKFETEELVLEDLTKHQDEAVEQTPMSNEGQEPPRTPSKKTSNLSDRRYYELLTKVGDLSKKLEDLFSRVAGHDPMENDDAESEPPDLDEKELKRICLRTNDSTHSA